MPATPPSQSLPVRRGVTLLELLVVLVLMGLAAAVVAPTLVRSGPPRLDDETDGDAARDAGALVANARRTAIRRGEPLRLRLASDGVWALVSFRDGGVISTGRTGVDSSEARALDLRIDAMGGCIPSGAYDVRLQAAERAFDPLVCRADGDAR